jgi:hypothetical protein
MSQFKLTFLLKQHTPIIHFHPNQHGATLRATELKPKFDRFLLKYVFNNDFDKYKYYLIGYDERKDKEGKLKKEDFKGKEAFDYKVKIEQDLSKSKQINSRESLFFGNMGDGDDKEYKKHNKSFKIEFFSFKPQIIEAIKKHFEAFLANNNFGTRQSKGYGGFYLDNKDLNTSLIPYKVFSFKSNHWEKDIRLFYQFLRQGINLKNRNQETTFYTKPAIFTYAKSKGWQWDKKSIKEKFFRSALNTQISAHKPSDVLEYSSNEKYLLRDLFGLSSTQEWKNPYNTTISKDGKNKDAKDKSKAKIERFKSPITFKIVNNIIYFWANKSYKKVLGEPFIIKVKGNRETLELPYPKEFDFEDFLNYAKNINLKQHIEEKFHNTNEFKSLKRILDDIKANK